MSCKRRAELVVTWAENIRFDRGSESCVQYWFARVN